MESLTWDIHLEFATSSFCLARICAGKFLESKCSLKPPHVTTQWDETQNDDPNAKNWAPRLLSTKVLQAKRVEQDLGRTKLSPSPTAQFDPLKMGIFLIDPVEGPKGRTFIFPLWIAKNSTAIFLQRKILAFHRIPPLVCHNGHDPALTCRKTWKRRSVPALILRFFVHFYHQKNPPRWYSWWKKSGDHQLRLVVYSTYRVLYISGGARRISKPSTVCLCGREATARTLKPGELTYPTLGKWKSSLKKLLFDGIC